MPTCRAESIWLVPGSQLRSWASPMRMPSGPRT
jgi:hypothetical protein